jgi:hypothetical protein
MSVANKQSRPNDTGTNRQAAGAPARRRNRRILLRTLLWAAVVIILLALAAMWLGGRAEVIRSELDAAARIVPQLQSEITNNRPEKAEVLVQQLRDRTTTAREAAEDPLWTLASAIPLAGPNLSAVAEVARSADDVATLGATPLVRAFDSLSWDSLMPNAAGTNLEPLQKAAPSVASAAHAVRISLERLDRIDTTVLLPQVAEPLVRSKEQLLSLTGALNASADAAQIAPAMLGAEVPRNYLLIIQNNAEARASGGIPGALAVLSFDEGKLTLGSQSTAGALGTMSPVIAVDPAQQQIYSERLGKFMQDVNLTPDFPTAANIAQAMWDRKTGQRVDGVISVDPVALGYILDGTGPIKVTNPELRALAAVGLPTQLTGENVVKTLLSDVYSKIEQPPLQDAYFAGVAQEIFSTLSDGKGNAKGLFEGLARGTAEGRVLVWSGLPAEQSLIGNYAMSGSVAGPSVAPAQFGVYFNDGTGAKMDYHVKRTVQLLKECSQNGYEQTTVRVTSTNTAPADAANSLPAYVTGGGAFGVPPGSVQTNIVAYGPVQANMETAVLDGQRTGFASHRHADRPVGVVDVRLAPGESKTVELTFGKIIQHAEPNVVVTPTVRAVKDVILPTISRQCG